MKTIYIEGDAGKEMVVPEGTVISLEDVVRVVNILLEKERCKCSKLVE